MLALRLRCWNKINLALAQHIVPQLYDVEAQTQNNLFVTQQQKTPYICNQRIKIHYNICCADQEICIKINVDRYHVGHNVQQ